MNNQAYAHPQPPPGTMIPIGTQQPFQVQQVIVQATINYGKDPLTMKCPHCQKQIQTLTKSSPGAMGKHFKNRFFPPNPTFLV